MPSSLFVLNSNHHRLRSAVELRVANCIRLHGHTTSDRTEELPKLNRIRGRPFVGRNSFMCIARPIEWKESLLNPPRGSPPASSQNRARSRIKQDEGEE
jgi:hypothetical protein